MYSFLKIHIWCESHFWHHMFFRNVTPDSWWLTWAEETAWGGDLWRYLSQPSKVDAASFRHIMVKIECRANEPIYSKQIRPKSMEGYFDRTLTEESQWGVADNGQGKWLENLQLQSQVCQVIPFSWADAKCLDEEDASSEQNDCAVLASVLTSLLLRDVILSLEYHH